MHIMILFFFLFVFHLIKEHDIYVWFCTSKKSVSAILKSLISINSTFFGFFFPGPTSNSILPLIHFCNLLLFTGYYKVFFDGFMDFPIWCKKERHNNSELVVQSPVEISIAGWLGSWCFCVLVLYYILSIVSTTLPFKRTQNNSYIEDQICLTKALLDLLPWLIR